MNRILLALALACLPACLSALTITADITTDTTWTNADSPILLNPSGASGGTITVRNGATLTIDASGGAITVNWNEDCDFAIGNGASEQGTLKIKAANAVTFGLKTGGNIRIKNNGQLLYTDITATTTFTRFDGSNTWGALIFEAGQTRQSEVKKSVFSYGGNDSKNALIVVDNSSTNTPTFNDLSFSNEAASGKAAMRFIGNGINTLKEGAFTLPFSVSGVTYVFRIGDISSDTVTATAPVLHFPDITSPDTPTNLLTGTLAVGDASNCSIIKFDDAYTFKCSASSSTKVKIVNGAVWGSSECQPLFETVSGSPTYTNWAGLVADSTTIANVFDGQGPFAYLTVRNATTGVDINSGTTFIPVSGQQTNWCFPGLVIKKCDTGFRVRTQLDASGNGYCTILKNADIGAPSSTDDCNVNCVLVDYGRVILDSCQLKGSVNNAVNTGTTSVSQRTNVTIRGCRISDTATSTNSTAINNNSCQGNCDLTIERTIIEGWRTGVSFFQTSTGGYTPTRTFTMRNSFISGDASGTNISSTGVNIQIQTAAVCTVLVEECTIAGVNKTGTGTARGFWLQELRSGSSMTVRRTNIDSNTDYGVDVVSATNNLCQYTFEECSITVNGDGGTDEGGIRDRRTQSAKVVANHCTFAGNNPRGATDNSATQQMLAENCYWNASNGPSGSGPGSGDAVSTNVDYSPFLARPYIGLLTGGAPAGASTLAVGNADGSATLPDQLHIIDDDEINVVWTFASDFNASTQSAYEFDIDDNANFGSLLLNGSKTSSSSTDITVTPTLAAGTVYYVRLRLWDAKDRMGPWYYATFRTNSVPPQVGNTNRSPADTSSTGDATPTFVWERPTDADEDPLHFYVEVDTATTFDTANLRLANSKQLLTNGAFEISTDSGTTWLPLPSTGAPQGQTIRCRLVSPTTWPNGLGTLTNTTWYWRVRASDGYEYGSYATNWSISVTRSYTFSGRLVDTGGSAVNGATIKVAHNGTVLGVSDDTDASGDYAFTVSDDLKLGDILVFFRDGGAISTRATRVTHFTGESMSGQDLKYRVIRVTSKLTTALTNSAFTADDGVDADIMWSESSGTVTIGGSTLVPYTVEVGSAWNVDGHVTGLGNDTAFVVLASGAMRTSTGTISMYSLDNDGSIEVTNGRTIEIEANSTTSGTFDLIDSTLSFRTGGLTLTFDKGTLNFKSSTAVKSVLVNGDAGTIVVDSASTADPAVATFRGVVFSTAGVTFETDGICASFTNCTFKDGILTRHIYWKCTDARSITTFQGIQFDYSLTQGSQFNVESTSNALVLSLIGCGGIRYGEGYDKNGGSEGDSLDNKVLWSLMPPKDVKVLAGDTRNRLEWTTDAQASLSGAGYNVYRSTDPSTAPPWGSPLNGASPITTNSYNDTSLTNGTTYWYYVTCVDSNTSPDTESGRSAYVSATPGAPSVTLLSPGTTASTSILAMTIVCAKTHMDSNATVSITTGGGSGLTVNDTIVLSPTLMLTDVTLSSATVATWTVTAARNDVWGISAYDESVSSNLTVSANSNENRPTISFTNPTEDGDTSGTFTIGLSYSANSGDSVDTSALELYASRDVTVQSVNRTAGTNLAQIGSFWDTLNSTTATCNVGQTSGTELFANGEYTLTARIGNTTGKKSEWITRRFYVEGAGSTVAKTTTLLKQGDKSVSVVITGTFSVNVNGVSFGSNITTLSYTKDSGTQVTAVVNVDQLAACGPRTFTVDLASGTDPQGQIVVEYPTNILPAYTNAETPRNPGIAGLNVFLINGAFFKSETDIATRGRMMGMSWSRFYRSDVACNGPLGNGWLGYYYQRAIFTVGAQDHISWYAPDGRKEQYDGISPIPGPAGVYASAAGETTHFTTTITDRHGHKCIFNSQGRLMECVDRNGNKVKLEYNYVGQLIKITDDRGKTWEITYYSHGRVQKVQDKVWSTGSPREVEYTYDSNGDMVEQKAPTTSRYDGSPKSRVTSAYRYVDHRLTECVNPNEFALGGTPASFMENRYEYDANSGNWRIVAQRLGGQDQWLYLRYVSSTLVREIDRRGLRTEYTIDASGRTTKVERYTKFWSVDTEDPVDHTAAPTEVSGKVRASDPDKYTTDFTYNDNHEVTSVTYPRGNKVAYTYTNPTEVASGTSTGISANVMTDSGASWTPSAFVGMTLRMTGGSGYLYYPIVANTGTTITVDSVYSLQADGLGATTPYSVQTNNPDPFAKGNLLKVTRSDEALGSLADIVTEYTYENRYQFVKTAKNPRGYTTTYVYDWEDSASQTDSGRGNLVRVEYPNVTIGQPSTQTIKVYMTYNQYGQPVTAVDGEGNVTLYKYYTDGQGHDGFLFQRISAQGSLDLTSEYDYDNAGNVTAQWPPRAFEPGATKDNFKTTFVVNEFDQVTKVTGPLLRTTGSDRTDSFYYYDWNGNLTNTLREYVTDAGTEPSAPSDADDPATFSKSSTEMAATWHETVVKYDILNRPFERTVDAIAGSPLVKYTYRTLYDRSDNVTDSISPLGNRSRTVYDERDMVFTRTAGADSDVAAIYTSNYDANGNVSTSVDARSFSTSYAYDGFDRTTTVTDPAGHFRETDYDVNSNVTETRAKNAGSVLLAKTQFTYDELDRTTQVKRLANDRLGNAMGDGWQTSSTLFDKNSRVTESTDDNGVKHYRFYDAANRTLYVRDARGNETRFDYNLDGATTRTTYMEVNDITNAVEKSHIECTFDYVNRCIKYRDQRYNVSTNDTERETKFDGWSRVTESKDAADITTDYRYDLLSRTVRVSRKPGASQSTWTITYSAYDADSRVTEKGIYETPDTLSNPQTTRYFYDERSRLTTLQRADGDIYTRQYDANSNVTQWSDPEGNVVNNTYDPRNFIQYRNVTRGDKIMGGTYECYVFDGLGRLESCSNYENTRLMVASRWEYDTLSLPELYDQTIGDSTGSIVGTYTTKAEYDGAGYRTATIVNDVRRTEIARDSLNRVRSVYDVTYNNLIATFMYAGGRLIERTTGDGTKMKVTYEASGCGCGGFSALVERVEYSKSSDGQVLAAVDRRYDKKGNMTAEREDHFGHFGNVFRYDDADRLTTGYYGVTLTGSNLTTYASPANTPTTFALKRTFNLDPRGNRTGSSGVRDQDDSVSPVTIKDTNYTVSSDKMNLYTDIDGKAMEYDVIEQCKRDRSVEHYIAYDYRGLEVARDDDAPSSPLPSPFMINTHDCLGRLCLTEWFHDGAVSGVEPDGVDICMQDVCDVCPTCTGSAGPGPVAELKGGGPGPTNIQATTFFDYGPNFPIMLSGDASNPLTAVRGPTADTVGPCRIAETVVLADLSVNLFFRAVNQLGSLIMRTNASGARTDVEQYTEHGGVLQYPVVFDGQKSLISSVTSNSPESGITNLHLTSGLLTSGALKGMTLVVSVLDIDSNTLRIGRVVDNDTDDIWVLDDDSIAGAIYHHGAIQNGFVVCKQQDANEVLTSGAWDTVLFANPDTDLIDTGVGTASAVGQWVSLPNGTWAEIISIPNANTVRVSGDRTEIVAASDPYVISKLPYTNLAYSTAGQWTAESFASSETTLTDASATFNSYMVGWQIIIDMEFPMPLTITAVPSATTLKVAGDVRTLTDPGKFYILFAPPKVNPADGTLATIVTEGEDDEWYDVTGSLYLWAGYRYVPPMVGFNDAGTTRGAQAGNNKLGNYHCTNRVYSIQAGRWLSPDQAANPAYNLFDYVGGAPLGRTDGTGLYYWDPGPTGIRIDGPSNMAGDGSATGTWDPSSKYTMFKNGEGFGFAIKFHVHPDWYAKGYRFTQVVYIRTRFWCCCDDKVRERREYYIEMFDNESYVDTMLSRKQASVVGAAECPAGLKKIDQQRILISFIAKPTPAIRKALDKAGTKEDPPFRAVDLSDNLPKEEGCKNMRYERPDAGVAPGNKISDLIDGLGVGVPVVSRIYWTAEFDCNNKSAFLGARLTGVLDSGRYAFSSVSGQAVNHVD